MGDAWPMVTALTSSTAFGNLLSDPDIAAEFDTPFVRRMLAFEAAWTRAITPEGPDRGAALAAIDRWAGDLGPGCLRDGVPVPALVAQLRDGLDAPEAIHTGATSQDVVDTAMVLTLRAVQTALMTRLERVSDLLQQIETAHGAEPLVAHTRMQPARQATVSLRVSAWARGVRGAMSSGPTLDQVQIGGAIGTRDVSDAVASAVAAQLGLSLGPVWHSDRAGMADFGHWLVRITGALGKIGQDAALLAQAGALTLDGAGGSSAMPHKQNPVAAEALVTLARYTAAQQGALGQALVHEQERSGAAWALEWMTLPAMCEAAGAATQQAARLLSSIRQIGTP